jgi:hypothetical protein
MTHLTPGRITALVAGVPVALALVGWTSYNFVALAGTKTVPVTAQIPVHDGGVTADVTGGELVLKQGQVSTARLVGTEEYSLFRPVLTVNQAGASTSVSFRCRSYTGNCALNATLEVPVSVGVTLATEGGNASVPAFRGSLALNSQGGDVTAGSLAGNVQVQTAGGNVNVQDMAGPDADITSDGGDVTITCTAPPVNLQISSGGGNITLVLPPGSTPYNVKADAGGGTYTNDAPADTRSKNVITLDSTGGDITVTEGS